jgi:hypothetical protein
MDNKLTPRIGTFFIMVGLALLVVFAGSIMSREINGIYLLLSLAALVLGFLFRRNKPVSDSGRFGTIRRAGERSRQHREDRINRIHKVGYPPGKRRQPPASGRENEQENTRNENYSHE